MKNGDELLAAARVELALIGDPFTARELFQLSKETAMKTIKVTVNGTTTSLETALALDLVNLAMLHEMERWDSAGYEWTAVQQDGVYAIEVKTPSSVDVLELVSRLERELREAEA